MEPKPLLICTVGLPRSGKSTWSRQQGFPVINRDAVRIALHGKRFLADAEDMVATVTRYMVKSFFLSGNKVLILDECNVTEKRRKEWMSSSWRTVFQYIDTPDVLCCERAVATGQSDLLPVIARMQSEFDYVPMLKNLDGIIACQHEQNIKTEWIELPEREYVQALWEIMGMEEFQAQDIFVNDLTGQDGGLLDDLGGNIEYHDAKLKLREESCSSN